MELAEILRLSISATDILKADTTTIEKPNRNPSIRLEGMLIRRTPGRSPPQVKSRSAEYIDL